MKFFEKFTSNTYAGSSNQLFFSMPDGESKRGRAFYKISVSGKYNYSFLFSNIIDSTYSDGRISHKNLICDSWVILEGRVGKSSAFRFDESECPTVTWLSGLTFDHSKTKEVMPGEFFSSDPIELYFEKGEYLCLEIIFSGKMIPYHEETLLPVYIKEDSGWRYSRKMPLPAMVGCDRKVKKRVAFLGDSITQGIGTEINSYAHWNALIAEKIGEEYSFWNLGIGYGRANDAASDGAWLYKAKQNDIVFVCFGVNDILQGMSLEQMKDDLSHIVDTLVSLGIQVVLQTVPPFDYEGKDIEKWEKINDYIKTELSKKVMMVFDNVLLLSVSDEKAYMARFGGHPNAEGCRVWADALYSCLTTKCLLA